MATASDPFLAELDTMGVMESHLQSIYKLENAQSQRLLDIYRRVRQELRDRMDILASGTIEAQQVRMVLAQVELGIQELVRQIKGQLDAQVDEISIQGIRDVVQETQQYEEHFRGALVPIPIDAVLVADSTKALKLIQYESSLQTYGQMLIDSINRILVDATVARKPYLDVVRAVSGRGGFLDSEAWKAQRIVRTELHSIYDMARFDGLREIQRQTIPDLQKISIDPIDSRTGLDSIAVKGQIKDLGEPFRFKGEVVDPSNGKSKFIEVEPFMNHPNRPNDRGATAPYRKSWETGFFQ